MPALRLLCLHGYHGNKNVLRQQLAPLASGLESVAEFVTVDAPSLAEGGFGWWHGNFPSSSGNYRGWDRTSAWLTDLFAREPRFDGVFGFSQGAALAGLLPGMRAEHEPVAFDFAVMAGGFRSDMPAHQNLYAKKEEYALPSLHIMGTSDVIVPAADSRVLAGQFASPIVLKHAGGHVIPGTPAVRDRVAAFLREMAERKTRQSLHRSSNAQEPRK